MHQVKSGEGGEHGNLNPIFRCVPAYMCPVCHSTFASNICAKHHLGASYLQGRCVLGRSSFEWEVSGIGSSPWHCKLCEFVCEDLAQLSVHYCVHLPSPLPVTNFPDAGYSGGGGPFAGRCLNRRRRKQGEEGQGEHRGRRGGQKELKMDSGTKKLIALMIKMCLSLAQSKRDLEGAVFDTLLGECGLAEIVAMGEQGAVYQKKAVKGHSLGPPTFGCLGPFWRRWSREARVWEQPT